MCNQSCCCKKSLQVKVIISKQICCPKKKTPSRQEQYDNYVKSRLNEGGEYVMCRGAYFTYLDQCSELGISVASDCDDEPALACESFSVADDHRLDFVREKLKKRFGQDYIQNCFVHDHRNSCPHPSFFKEWERKFLIEANEVYKDEIDSW